MICRIYLVEDKVSRHRMVGAVVDRLNANAPPEFTYLRGTEALENRDNILRYLTNAESLLEAALDPESVLLLDIDLTTGFERYDDLFAECWDTIRNRLRESAANGQPLAIADHEIGHDQCAAALVCERAIQDRWGIYNTIATCLAALRLVMGRPVIIVSAQYDPALDVTCGDNTFEIPASTFPEENEPAGDRRLHLVDACAKITAASRQLTRYHENPAIDKALRMFATPYVNQWEAAPPRSWLWGHQHYQAASFGDCYCKVGRKWLGQDIAPHELQALTEVDNGYARLTRGYTLQKNSLVAVLEALEIPDPLVNGERWHLPLRPGLAFLFSLKEFLLALRDSGNPPHRSLSFGMREEVGQRVYWVDIELEATDGLGVGPLLEAPPPHDGAGGLRRAMSNVLSSTMATEDKVAGRSLLVNLGDYPWLGVFCSPQANPGLSQSSVGPSLRFAWESRV